MDRIDGPRPHARMMLLTTRSSLPASAEQRLLDDAKRALLAPEGWSALALRLSGLASPAPRPHHRRIARALLAEAAASRDGHAYCLRNGDLVLLCRSSVTPLAATCARLFRPDAPDPDALLTAWTLDRDGDALMRFAAARLADPLPDPASPNLPAAQASEAALCDLTRRQTAVLLSRNDAAPMRPLFREITLPVAPMRARLAVDGRPTDPFLLRHMAGRLGARVLEALLRAGSLDGPFAARRPGTQALHLNLTVAGALSPAFAEVVKLAQASGASLGVEVALTDALADPALFHRLRRTLRDAGVVLALDEVSRHLLLVTRPEALDADLVKLDWHPALPDADFDAALDRIGPDRIVLHRADTEAAVAWGLGRGIRRFQGQRVDDMLAARRARACLHGKGCTLHQCAERASAASVAGRAGCRNPALLDADAP